ncbi:MAG: M23 family metallopeptidase [Defluviitaleaceae bacterium]|nr:M23 family metallopeptidase [Defluviitaleaceae bacterium]
MNDKVTGGTPTPPKKPGSKNKGFYAALYACVGVMLVMAAIIGYANLTRDTHNVLTPQDYTLADENRDDTYGLFDADAIEVAGDREYPLHYPYDGYAQATSDEDDHAADEPNYGQNLFVDYGYEREAYYYDFYLGWISEEEYYALRRRREEQEQETPPALQQTFAPFSENDGMNWPIVGEIVMVYSTDRLVFDATLEQFRTNDNLSIGASLGDAINAAAAGRVIAITSTRERGNTVVIDHGNGWRTTYSQLRDDILVREGDVVAKGQQIGNVGTPSIHSSRLGPHLAFSVHQDDSSIDPRRVLN